MSDQFDVRRLKVGDACMLVTPGWDARSTTVVARDGDHAKVSGSRLKFDLTTGYAEDNSWLVTMATWDVRVKHNVLRSLMNDATHDRILTIHAVLKEKGLLP